ncbi:MAG: 2-polyprenyl-6-hydroxyphenyl methylase / 3-demethylubiquinone-9 3-methyltransferase [Acidobacteriota bacterium]|nr:2-polyprenyl-6-hydroxyphenyl methylase / 3-demethylubiquinone-9 3-methyltransferase [Acidobacteriota bacterium]
MEDVEKLLRFDLTSTDWLEDCVKEVAFICRVDEQRAREFVEEELRFDKLCKQRNIPVSEYLRGPHLPAEFHYITSQVTQPLRIPGPGRLASLRAVLHFLEENDAPGSDAAVLDYGGGGGRDSIAFARKGLRTALQETASFLMSPGEGHMVSRRFLGRNLQVEFIKVGAALAGKFDYANCVDVLEHCYDVEYALSEITLALKEGGRLFVWGDFDNVVYNGDHLEKNRFYARSGVWPRLMKRMGYTLVADRPAGSTVEVWRLEKKPGDSLEEILMRGYETTREWAKSRLGTTHLRSLKYWAGEGSLRSSTYWSRLLRLRGGGARLDGRALQNLADTFYTLELVSERIRTLRLLTSHQ